MYQIALHCNIILPLFLTEGHFILSTFHNICSCYPAFLFVFMDCLIMFWLVFQLFHIINSYFSSFICDFCYIPSSPLIIFRFSQNPFSWSSLLFHWTNTFLLSWQVHFITIIALQHYPIRCYPNGGYLRKWWHQFFGSLLLLWLCTVFRINHNLQGQVQLTLLVHDVEFFHYQIYTWFHCMTFSLTLAFIIHLVICIQLGVCIIVLLPRCFGLFTSELLP